MNNRYIEEGEEDIISVLESFLKESEANRGLNLKKKYIHAAIKEINELRDSKRILLDIILRHESEIFSQNCIKDEEDESEKGE